MELGLPDCYRMISERINDGSCIAFIGAGASATYKYNDRVYKGLPLAKDLLSKLKKDRVYLKDIDDLGQAAFLLRYHEGRSTLETFLMREFEAKDIEPLPCHQLLAKLQFPCYVSMNFDNLLERAIKNEGIDYLPIIEDSDVPLIGGQVIPVIKPHGSADRPKTMCIATDEILDFKERIPIISDLLNVYIAKKIVLFIGFSMGDPDFISIVRYLKRCLGEYMPRSFAVILNKKPFLEKFWDENNVTIIEHDATKFLTELYENLKKLRFQLQEDLEPWMKNQFFWELLEIRGLPTETQVIEALLKEIKRKLSQRYSIKKLEASVSDAIKLVLSYRPNFSALLKISEELNKIFNYCIKSKVRVWDEFKKLENKRAEITRKINAKATKVIDNAHNILIYSQSKRVADLLLALDPVLQKEIVIYIGECRPKSPKPFQDAILTSKLLGFSSYKIRFLPDMAIFHLMCKSRIDLVLMGAHAVYKSKSNDYTHFVNTCGSNAIVNMSSIYNIPVKIIFEKDKEVIYDDISVLKKVSFDEEENIAIDAIHKISLDTRLAERTLILNIGYDLVNIDDNISVVTD